jgi:hypothetical protein
MKCRHCLKELSEEKGETVHGCLDCHYCPKVNKIYSLELQLMRAQGAISVLEKLSGYEAGGEFQQDDVNLIKDTLKSIRPS